MKASGALAAIHSEGNIIMANFAKLVEDVPAELTAVTGFVTGIEKLISDSKAAGLSTVTISDIESLVPDAETVIKDTEAVIGDL
jgi:hypothetical protein